MYLYICEGYKDKGSTEELLVKALETFAEETGNSFGGFSREILRTEKGKPYFSDIPVQFSVSHTGDIWACIMAAGSEPVGLDIQTIRDYSYAKIADRYYTESEHEYLREKGQDGFFEIWTRKEAYAKYTGKGIGSYLAEFDTLNSNECIFREVNVAEGIQGACCSNKEGILWIRRI